MTLTLMVCSRDAHKVFTAHLERGQLWSRCVEFTCAHVAYPVKRGQKRGLAAYLLGGEPAAREALRL